MSKKITLLLFVALFLLLLAACGGAVPVPTVGALGTSKPTAAGPAQSPVATKAGTAAATKAATAAATKAAVTTAPAVTKSAGTTGPAGTAGPSQGPVAAQAFTATIEMVAINPAQNIQIAQVNGPTATTSLFTPGVIAVPPGVPQYIRGNAMGLARGSSITSYQWAITGPTGSTAKITEVPIDAKTGIMTGTATFTPDKTGTYKVTLTVKDNAGKSSTGATLNIEAATYIGASKCQACHSDQYTKWSQTAHAAFFTEMVDQDSTGKYGQLGFRCARCHTAGYYNDTTASTGGWWDVAVNTLKFQWPPEKIGQAGAFEAMPQELKDLSNIQCENCHGPGSNHNGDKTKIGMSMNAGVCDQCHDEGKVYVRGEQLANSVHIHANEITAPNGRSACARCHSPGGFVDFLNDVPAEKQRNTVGEIACATCHDPHDTTNNFAQLRIMGATKSVPVEATDAGLSTSCEECHNGRTTADQVVNQNPSFPHYSAAEEAINGGGGYDFGAQIPNSPHGTIVGAGPIKDASGNTLYDGNKPGPCVYCHMAETPGGNSNLNQSGGAVTDTTDPGHNLVGSHTFLVTATRPNGERFEHVTVCQPCHAGVTTFNFPAKADYDGNGKTEGVQDEIKGLLNTLAQALTSKGVKVTPEYPYFTLPDSASTEIKGAVYNYRFVAGVIPTGEGRAATIHNFQRAVALLQVSYAKVMGSDIPNATILYK